MIIICLKVELDLRVGLVLLVLLVLMDYLVEQDLQDLKVEQEALVLQDCQVVMVLLGHKAGLLVLEPQDPKV